jgi:hypothetical protein
MISKRLCKWFVTSGGAQIKPWKKMRIGDENVQSFQEIQVYNRRPREEMFSDNYASFIQLLTREAPFY